MYIYFTEESYTLQGQYSTFNIDTLYYKCSFFKNWLTTRWYKSLIKNNSLALYNSLLAKYAKKYNCDPPFCSSHLLFADCILMQRCLKKKTNTKFIRKHKQDKTLEKKIEDLGQNFYPLKNDYNTF